MHVEMAYLWREVCAATRQRYNGFGRVVLLFRRDVESFARKRAMMEANHESSALGDTVSPRVTLLAPKSTRRGSQHSRHTSSTASCAGPYVFRVARISSMSRRRRPPRPGALADLSPTRILSQIVILQLAYYACATVLILFTALVFGSEINTDLLFSWRSLRGDTTVGWTLGLVWVLNSLTW